jgi:hypothetical protein
MGKKLWAAFTCSALADAAGNAKERQRLFSIGYEQGKMFLDAIKAGKIDNQDFDNNVPFVVTLMLHGSLSLRGPPSADFILGRIFEAAIDEATKQPLAASDKNAREIIANQNYANMNCSLL